MPGGPITVGDNPVPQVDAWVEFDYTATGGETWLVTAQYCKCDIYRVLTNGQRKLEGSIGLNYSDVDATYSGVTPPGSKWAFVCYPQTFRHLPAGVSNLRFEIV